MLENGAGHICWGRACVFSALQFDLGFCLRMGLMLGIVSDTFFLWGVHQPSKWKRFGNDEADLEQKTGRKRICRFF